ncbi:MAG: hypothetical protein JXB38_19960 [Anaerolineales bacterium]|nr:hypothetical protein [Anaerolineales bacterium]
MSTVRLGIPIGRIYDYRHLAPIIDAALGRGWQVTCWHRFDSEAEQDLIPTYANGQTEIIAIEDFKELETLAEQVDCVIAGAPPAYYGIEKTKPWVHVQRALDSFLANREIANFLTADLFCAYTSDWVDWYVQFLENSGQALSVGTQAQLEAISVPVGFPELDVLPQLDESQVRAELGIPADRPVVLFLPSDACGRLQPTVYCQYIFTVSSRLKQLWKFKNHLRWEYLPYIWRGWNYKNLIARVRHFATNQNAVMAVKARSKYPLLAEETAAADQVFYDVSFYPATILKLLKIADLAVGFNSVVATEALAAAVPYVEVRLPDRDTAVLYTELQHNFSDLWDAPGAVTRVPLASFLQNFARQQFGDFGFDEAARQRYLDRFVGPLDGQASQRVLDAVQERLLTEAKG